MGGGHNDLPCLRDMWEVNYWSLAAYPLPPPRRRDLGVSFSYFSSHLHTAWSPRLDGA